MHRTAYIDIPLGDAEVTDQWGEDPRDVSTSKFEVTASYFVRLNDDATQVQSRELKTIFLDVDRIGDDGDREQKSLTLHPEEFYQLVDLLGAVGHHGERPKPTKEADSEPPGKTTFPRATTRWALDSGGGADSEPPGKVNVVDLEQNENVTTWKCRGCGGGGGLAGQGDGSPDDRVAVDLFWEEVRRHELGECLPNKSEGPRRLCQPPTDHDAIPAPIDR